MNGAFLSTFARAFPIVKSTRVIFTNTLPFFFCFFHVSRAWNVPPRFTQPAGSCRLIRAPLAVTATVRVFAPAGAAAASPAGVVHRDHADRRVVLGLPRPPSPRRCSRPRPRG